LVIGQASRTEGDRSRSQHCGDRSQDNRCMKEASCGMQNVVDRIETAARIKKMRQRSATRELPTTPDIKDLPIMKRIARSHWFEVCSMVTVVSNSAWLGVNFEESSDKLAGLFYNGPGVLYSVPVRNYRASWCRHMWPGTVD